MQLGKADTDHQSARELATVVDKDHLRRTMQPDQTVKDFNNVFGQRLPLRLDGYGRTFDPLLSALS